MMASAVCVCVCLCVCEDLADLFTIRMIGTGRQLCVQPGAQKGGWASDRVWESLHSGGGWSFFFFQVNFLFFNSQIP